MLPVAPGRTEEAKEAFSRVLTGQESVVGGGVGVDIRVAGAAPPPPPHDVIITVNAAHRINNSESLSLLKSMAIAIRHPVP